MGTTAVAGLPATLTTTLGAADAVAISFVRDADAVRQVRAICEDAGCPNMMIISKIECALALDNLDEILARVDALTAEQLQQVACEVFDEARILTLIYD